MVKTEELIEWLVVARSSKYCWDEIDKKIVNAIIKRLEEYEKLKKDCLRAQEHEVRNK